MAQPLDIEALEARVEADPGDPAFGTLAEAYRRLGRLDDARRVAVAGLAVLPDDTRGRLALGLALLDLGETAAARYELERAMGQVAAEELVGLQPARDPDQTQAGVPLELADAREEGLDDAELDAAFDSAEPVRDEMLDATRVAQEAMRAGKLDEPEGFSIDTAPNLASETMARLLEKQGDPGTADAIRERLQSDGPARLDAAEMPADPASSQSAAPAANGSSVHPPDRVLATLEAWLANLQRTP
jgi:hypothetical protein